MRPICLGCIKLTNYVIRWHKLGKHKLPKVRSRTTCTTLNNNGIGDGGSGEPPCGGLRMTGNWLAHVLRGKERKREG
jgi:hypothetical protein